MLLKAILTLLSRVTVVVGVLMWLWRTRTSSLQPETRLWVFWSSRLADGAPVVKEVRRAVPALTLLVSVFTDCSAGQILPGLITKFISLLLRGSDNFLTVQ